MFPMMTPIDAIGLSLRAGMMFGQSQTLWMTRMMEMQGFWAGYPRLATSAPVAEEELVVDAEDAPPVVLAPLTEVHAETVVAAAVEVIEDIPAEPEPELLPEPEPVTLVAEPPPAAVLVEPSAVAKVETLAPAPAEPAAPEHPIVAAEPPQPAPAAAARPKHAKKPAPRAE